jgi:sigma-B regulation protein RsbU (phosphoserine phosphatase)
MDVIEDDHKLTDEPPRRRPKNPFDALAGYASIAAQNTNCIDDGAPSPFPRFSSPAEQISAGEMKWDGTALLSATDIVLDGAQKELDALRAEINVLRRRDETLNFYMARLDEELRLAARLQQDFLPKILPQVGRAHFHVLFRPAGYVSGDLYDVLRLDEKHVAFFLVDAVGHGMPAALLTMFIKRALCCKEVGPAGYRLLPPGETLGRVNDALVEQNLSAATFATALYGVLNIETLELTLATAGHPAPLLLRGETMHEVVAEGALLGVFDHELYVPLTVQLQAGDRLLIYSDGVEVAFGEDIAAQKGQWRNELFDRRFRSAEDLVLSFAEQLDRETGSLQPRDDLTLLVLEIR